MVAADRHLDRPSRALTERIKVGQRNRELRRPRQLLPARLGQPVERGGLEAADHDAGAAASTVVVLDRPRQRQDRRFVQRHRLQIGSALGEAREDRRGPSGFAQRAGDRGRQRQALLSLPEDRENQLDVGFAVAAVSTGQPSG
jgi:hypothetical protein